MLYQTDLKPRRWGALTWTRQLVNKASHPQNGLSVHDDVRWLFFNNAKVSLGFQTRAAVGRLNRRELINK